MTTNVVIILLFLLKLLMTPPLGMSEGREVIFMSNLLNFKYNSRLTISLRRAKLLWFIWWNNEIIDRFYNLIKYFWKGSHAIPLCCYHVKSTLGDSLPFLNLLCLLLNFWWWSFDLICIGVIMFVLICTNVDHSI